MPIASLVSTRSDKSGRGGTGLAVSFEEVKPFFKRNHSMVPSRGPDKRGSVFVSDKSGSATCYFSCITQSDSSESCKGEERELIPWES